MQMQTQTQLSAQSIRHLYPPAPQEEIWVHWPHRPLTNIIFSLEFSLCYYQLILKNKLWIVWTQNFKFENQTIKIISQIYFCIDEWMGIIICICILLQKKLSCKSISLKKFSIQELYWCSLELNTCCSPRWLKSRSRDFWTRFW